MEIIINMISITNLKLYTVALALLALAQGVPARALDLGDAARRTPYDPYLIPVKTVLSKVDGEEDSMRRVRDLMNIGRSFRYLFTQPYTAATPEITAARRAGDCKDKALWLISQLNDESVRFVIGKARRSSTISHAWVMWEHEGRWWILDCTNRRDPVPADRVGPNSYIPMYSFSKHGSYRHQESASLLASRGHQEPVASPSRRNPWR